jgi:SAM-dependent methyltransferase
VPSQHSRLSAGAQLDAIDRINLEAMRRPSVVAEYACASGLLGHESAALAQVAAEFHGQRILDLGVGGGRTVPALLQISGDYLGVDNSPEMVAACRARFPDVEFALEDARQLDGIPDGSVSLAVFSCNGISMVKHEDRLAILQAVHRVLKPGGALVFTTYNRNCPEVRAGFRWPHFVPSWNPARFVVRAARFVRSVVVSLRNRREFVPLEQHTDEFALINDRCHDHSVMLYYITPSEQRRQLHRAGFIAHELVFDGAGSPMGDEGTHDSMAFIARKAAALR